MSRTSHDRVLTPNATLNARSNLALRKQKKRRPPCGTWGCCREDLHPGLCQFEMPAPRRQESLSQASVRLSLSPVSKCRKVSDIDIIPHSQIPALVSGAPSDRGDELIHVEARIVELCQEEQCQATKWRAEWWTRHALCIGTEEDVYGVDEDESTSHRLLANEASRPNTFTPLGLLGPAEETLRIKSELRSWRNSLF